MKYLEKLLNINRFLSTISSPNIHSVQAYISNINISDIFSITFDTPYETLPPLTRIDNTTEKILHLQYSHLTSAAVFSNGDCLLNSISLIFNANQTLALQFRLAMIVELMKFSDFYLASVIQRPIMSIYPPTTSQLISSLYSKLIEPRIKTYDELEFQSIIRRMINLFSFIFGKRHLCFIIYNFGTAFGVR
ncbi:unnamed protein product [Rhizophagus irregularis]|nr:unnamed protein product [Rhizophagus irregularis]